MRWAAAPPLGGWEVWKEENTSLSTIQKSEF